MTLVGARGVVPVNVLGRGADRWGLLVLVLMLVWKRAWIWLLRLTLVLVFRLSLKERREVGAFRCIGAFFRHVCSFFSLVVSLPHSFVHSHSHSQLSFSPSFPLDLSCCCG